MHAGIWSQVLMLAHFIHWVIFPVPIYGVYMTIILIWSLQLWYQILIKKTWYFQNLFFFFLGLILLLELLYDFRMDLCTVILIRIALILCGLLFVNLVQTTWEEGTQFRNFFPLVWPASVSVRHFLINNWCGRTQSLWSDATPGQVVLDCTIQW